jgi:hypothetical protein
MAQHLIASKCTKCSRKLTDPVSIAFGIGPDCRKMMGFAEEDESNFRLRELCTEANVKTFARDYMSAFIATNEVRLMGFPLIAASMEEAVKNICKKQEGKTYGLPIIIMNYVDNDVHVYAPYKAEALPSWRGLMTWNKEKKRYENSVSTFNGRGFMEHLRSHYRGCMVTGPKGVFWPGIYESPVRHGQSGFAGVGDDGLPLFKEAC